MKTHNTQRTMGIVLITFSTIFMACTISTAQAQGYRNSYGRGSSKTMVALQGGLGTRSFTVKSDIDYLNNMKASQEGWETSLIFGGRMARVRSGFGSFKTNMNELNTIKQSSFAGMVNIYALDILGKTNKYFHPYVITGFDVNTFEFKGSYIPKAPLILSNPNTQQQCTCQIAGPGSPQPIEPPATSLAPNSAKMTSTQLVSGLGGEVSSIKDGRFFNMFGEVRYGLPVGVTTQNPVLNNTQIKNNMAVTFGIGFGISK